MGYYYYCNGDQFYGNGYCNTPWNNWGRWVLAGALIVIAILILLSLACIRNRRRRRMGLAPAYAPGFNQNVPYNNGPAYQAPYQQPANEGFYGPPYGAPYGGPQPGVELQQPQNVYARAGPDPEYGAPAGPPPGKGDGVIR